MGSREKNGISKEWFISLEEHHEVSLMTHSVEILIFLFWLQRKPRMVSSELTSDLVHEGRLPHDILKYCNIYVKWPHSCSITLDFWILTAEEQKRVFVTLQNWIGHTHLFWTSRIFKFFIKQLTYCNQLCRTVEQQWKKMHEKHSSNQFKFPWKRETHFRISMLSKLTHTHV